MRWWSAGVSRISARWGDGSSADARLPDQLVIFRMRADPEPYQPVRCLHSQGTVAIANPGGPEATDLLEVERCVSRVRFQMLERLVGELTHARRQRPVALPEIRGGVVSQRRVVLRAAWSASALSARASSRPARTSLSSCASHAAQSNPRNQARNCASSSADSASTCCSSFSTLPMAISYQNEMRVARCAVGSEPRLSGWPRAAPDRTPPVAGQSAPNR